MAVSNTNRLQDAPLQFGAVEPLQVSTLSPAPRDGDIFHFAFIDQICVIDGVCRKEEMQDANDLVVGDEYKFPAEVKQAQSEIALNGNEASVRILDVVEIGASFFSANRTHEVTMMSDVGQVLRGHVLTSSGGRVILALKGKADPAKEYALIALSAGQAH